MKIITKVAILAVLIMGAARVTGAESEKLQHRVRIKQVNEWQAIVYCRNGRTPSVNSQAIAGTIVVSCEGREE